MEKRAPIQLILDAACRSERWRSSEDEEAAWKPTGFAKPRIRPDKIAQNWPDVGKTSCCLNRPDVGKIISC